MVDPENHRVIGPGFWLYWLCGFPGFFRWIQQQSGTASWYNNTCSCGVLVFCRRWFHTGPCKSKIACENKAESSSLNHGLTTPFLHNQENTTNKTGRHYQYEQKGTCKNRPQKSFPKTTNYNMFQPSSRFSHKQKTPSDSINPWGGWGLLRFAVSTVGPPFSEAPEDTSRHLGLWQDVRQKAMCFFISMENGTG